MSERLGPELPPEKPKLPALTPDGTRATVYELEGGIFFCPLFGVFADQKEGLGRKLAVTGPIVAGWHIARYKPEEVEKSPEKRARHDFFLGFMSGAHTNEPTQFLEFRT